MSKYQENVGPSDGLNVKNAALLVIDHQVALPGKKSRSSARFSK